jgi:hypothetical protein
MHAAQTGRTHDRTPQIINLSNFVLAEPGPFSNRTSCVKLIVPDSLLVGSWFSPRSAVPPQHLVRSSGAAMSTTGSRDINPATQDPHTQSAFTFAPPGKRTIQVTT